MGAPTASVIINNHNYRRFLPQAIESALSQTYAGTEVVVVDDGSTDDSRAVIARYGERVVPVMKENGGQASAFNAGFAASRGDVVVFLDSDDVLLPGAVEHAVAALDGDVSKVQWPLWTIDAAGRRTGDVKAANLPAGDLRQEVARHGPSSALPSAPTSGNAWRRSFLEEVLPMPEDAFRVGADSYLFALAPALGRLARVDEPQALFRLHGRNAYQSRSFEEKLALGVVQEERQHAALAKLLAARGVDVDVEAWKARSWWHGIALVVRAVEEIVPPGEPFVLVDEDSFGTDELLAGRRRIPFPERDGEYWGRPAGDDAAVSELARHRRAGAACLVVAWPALWWLEHYAGFARHVRESFPCVRADERLVAFDLRR